MPVSLEHIRDQLLPGLRIITTRAVREGMPVTWEYIAQERAFIPRASCVPTVSIPAALAMGAAAVVIHNPPVTRRFWHWLQR